MKRFLFVSVLTLLAPLACAQAQTAKTLTVRFLDVRPDADLIYPKPGQPDAGNPSAGRLGAQPGYDPAARIKSGEVTEVPIRWSGLDLDGRGGADDYIDFKLRVVGSIDGFSSFAPLKWQPLGFGLNGMGVAPNAQVKVSVVDISLSPQTLGSVEFNGFTNASFLGFNFQGPWGFTGTINGNQVSGNGDTGSKDIRLDNGTLNPAAKQLLFQVTSVTSGAASVRGFDFGFRYEPSSFQLPSTGAADDSGSFR